MFLSLSYFGACTFVVSQSRPFLFHGADCFQYRHTEEGFRDLHSIQPMKFQKVQVEWSGNVNTLTFIPSTKVGDQSVSDALIS